VVIAEGDRTLLDGTAYRFVSVIARGRMSTVVEAVRSADQAPVVVKLLPEDLDDLAELAQRLRLEAEALSRLVHPNLVRVLDFGTTAAGVPFLVLERLFGRTLAAELRARGALPVGEALGLARQALSGLAAAHRVGIVHRDVKPANLFVCGEAGERIVKVLDFGIAKALGEAELLGLSPKPKTREGVRLGTPRFIAPEQVRAGLVTPATDVYALGLVLYQMLAGRHAFAEAQSVDELYRAQLVQMPPPPSSVAAQPIPAWLDRAVLRAIAKNPSDRFSDAAALADALARGDDVAVGSRSADTAFEATAITEPPRTAPARRTQTVAGLAAVAAGIDLLWRVGSGLTTVPQLVDPVGTSTELWGPPRAGAADAVALYGRIAALSDLGRAGLLGVASGALLVLAVRALSTKDLANLRAYVPWALGAVVLAFVLDALALALRGAMLSEIDAKGEAASVAVGVGFSVGVIAALGVPVFQIALLLLLRRLCRQT
jgi:serine/threonine-protein kinase